MRNVLKLSLSVALVILMGITYVGTFNDIQVAHASEYEVWGTYNTVKVQQDCEASKYNESRLSASLNYKMAKNEYENAQIIISAKSLINSFNATVGDLTNAGGNKILKENLTLYKQKYCFVADNMTTARPFSPGWYPDALVPLNKAYELGENKIKHGMNQGIQLTVKTNADTPSGAYTGSLELTIDDKTQNIPISVEVWDFAIPDEVHTQSAFYNRREWIVNGELDNSMEMYTKYHDFLLDYRISPTNLPYENAMDVDELVTLAKKYAANPKTSAYSIPYKIIIRTVNLIDPVDEKNSTKMIADIDYELFEKQIRALAENSTPELNLLKKAYMYFAGTLDEPQYSGALDEVRYITHNVNEILNRVANELEAGEPNYFVNHGLKKTDLTKMQNLITTYNIETLDGYVGTYVPQYSNFDAEVDRAEYKRLEQNEISSGTTWWYGCWMPKAPYPTYHIDDYLLTSRAVSWMQYEYGISGNLYWGTSNYAIADNAYAKPCNVWNDASRFIGGVANGDGFLVYPGIDYGMDRSLPSMRLESIRDGLEDYEYLYMYEKLIDEANTKYNLKLSANEVLSKLYRKLYSGTIANIDSPNFVSVREELASLISLLSTGPQVVAKVTEVNSDNATAKVEIIYDSSYSLKINNVEQPKTSQGTNGSKSVVEISLDKATNFLEGELFNGTNSYNVKYFVSNKLQSLSKFDSIEEVEKVGVSKGNISEAVNHIDVSYDNTTFNLLTTVKAVIRPSDMQSESDNLLYNPAIRFDKDKYFNSYTMRQLDEISFNVYNQQDYDMKVKLRLYSGNAFKQLIATVDLKANSWTKVAFNQIYANTWDKLDSVTRIALEFDNDLVNTRTIYIDNFYITFKA